MAEQLPITFEFRANQTFDDFYPSNNQEIIAQLKHSAEGKGENLIFLWGDAGHGKSHLLHACCHHAYQHNVSAFYLDLTTATANSPDILAGLEDVELVCLDNIDAIAGSKDWEKACFNFFNRQRERNHALILTAASAPNALGLTLPDLLTRVSWGLSLKIKNLDDDDKIAALTYKAKRMGFAFAPQAAQYLLTHYDRDLRALWLMLEKLDKASLAAQRRLTVPFLKQVLNDQLY